MAPCPRCKRANPAMASACVACGTPLALGDEPALRPLAVELDLDRRHRGRPTPASEEPVPSKPGEEAGPSSFEPDRSDWTISPDREPPLDEPPEWEDEPSEGPAWLAPLARQRLLAWAVDGGLLAAVGVVLCGALLVAAGLPADGGWGELLPVLLPGVAFVAVVAFVYTSVAHALAGATLGKRLAGLRVVAEDGTPLDPGRAALRSGCALLSLALAGAGLIPALFTPSGRALHDLLARTRVEGAP